jgi:mono/diheme cytochrome c family protein
MTVHDGGPRRISMRSLQILLAVALAFSPGIVSTGHAGDGKALFLENKCNLCHTIDSQAIARTSEKMKAPDLSNASGLVESADWLKSFLKKEVKKDDKNHQREFKGTDEELDAVVQWLMTLKKS